MSEVSGSIFSPPYDGLPPNKLLSHFRSRRPVQYFAVPSAEETRRDRIDAVLENRMDLNGETHQLSDPPDWLNNPAIDREWHISLHKFYYATGLGLAFDETGDQRYAQKWVDLTSSWIDQTPPRFINSQVAGRRIQNWIYAYYYFVSTNEAADVPADFHVRFLASLHEQVEALQANLDAARNHRTLEIYAIFLAAIVFPEFRQAPDWLAFSLREILDNMRNDLLADGVHCELSTDYHHTVLKNLLCIRRLAELNSIAVPAKFDGHLQLALDFSLHVHKPDGLIPSLSDGDIGSYLELLYQGYELFGRKELAFVASGGRQGTPPAQRSKGFPASGYYVTRSDWVNAGEPYADARYLVFDCGPIGAGNHGHLDLLSVELYAYGHSLVVDPGRYTYCETGAVNWRARFRGTAYHNTVVVDGLNQTRYVPAPKKFEIKGEPPAHRLHDFVSSDNCDFIHGTAISREYEATHDRRIFFAWQDYWVISDVMTASDDHRYDAVFHLGTRAQDRVDVRQSPNTWLIDTPNLLFAHPTVSGLDVELIDGFVSETYGTKSSAPILRFTQTGSDAAFHCVLHPFYERAPAIAVAALPVLADDTPVPDENACALQIAIDYGSEQFVDYCFFRSAGEPRWLRFGDFRFNGHHLLLRTSMDGRIVMQHLSAGSSLEVSAPVEELDE